MYKAVSLFGSTTLLVACSATPLVDEATKVRQIEAPAASSPCKFLGVMEVSGGMFYSSLPEARRDMLAKIRNETVKRGGNAYVLTTVTVERGFSLPFAQGDAYQCP